MRRVDWQAFEFVDSLINRKTGRPYAQRYLTPALYLELYLRWTPVDGLAAFYAQVMSRLRDRFVFHQNDRKNRASRIRDADAAFGYFTKFLTSKQAYAWVHLSDVDGVGSEKELGGVGPCVFEVWMRKANPDRAQAQLAQYLELTRHFETDMLPSGPQVSRVEVCFPVDAFASCEDFRTWVLATSLVSQGQFFSGSAGYKMLAYQGYDSVRANQRLSTILHDFPGFDFNPGIGDSMGRVLNTDRTAIVPVIKRVNWLTLVSEDGVNMLGGFDGLASRITQTKDLSMHALARGMCLQAGPAPTLARDEPGLSAYFEASHVLRPLRYRPHARDHYSLPNAADAKTWLYHFHEDAK